MSSFAGTFSLSGSDAMSSLASPAATNTDVSVVGSPGVSVMSDELEVSDNMIQNQGQVPALPSGPCPEGEGPGYGSPNRATTLPLGPCPEGEGSSYGSVKRQRRTGSRGSSATPMGTPRNRSNVLVPVSNKNHDRATSLPPIPTGAPRSLGPEVRAQKEEWRRKQQAQHLAIVSQNSAIVNASSAASSSQNVGMISNGQLSQIVALNQSGELVSQIPWNQVYGGVHVTHN